VHRRKLPAFVALVIVLAAVALVLPRALAVVTATWLVDSYENWDEGEGENVLISSEGEVRPGWRADRVELEFDAAWAALRLADGTIILGSDDGGTVYRAVGTQVKKLVTIKDAVAVVSLAVGKDGMVYAGTMPAGQIWRIDPQSGAANKLVALPDVETVWALAFDASGTALYAGTGPGGKLFRVDPKAGTATVAFATDDVRILTVAATGDGAIWLGTSDKAVVFRYDPKSRRARAMADFDATEVTSLAATADGAVVAAVNKFSETSSTGARTRAAAVKGTKGDNSAKGEAAKPPKTGSKPGAETETPSSAKLPRSEVRKGKGALYRIEGDGRLEQLHALSSTYFTIVAVDPQKRIFAGDGEKGRIYLVGADDAVSIAFDAPERQVSHIITDEQGLAFTTADSAALYRAAGAGAKAVYTSKVNDLKVVAQLGRIVWHGQGELKIETRSGNTAEPSKGWSSWSAPKTRADAGGGAQGGRVSTPPGRYVQFRVTFGTDRDAVLSKFALYYLPQNRPSKITDIEIGSGKDGLVTITSGAAKPRSPVTKISWKVDNPDSDETSYVLAVRRDGDVNWRPLPTKGGLPITATSYEWNTETFPDGYYRVRITASDARANADARALVSQRTTALFLVDNNKPTLSGIAVRYPAATALATDSMSAIAEAAYSIDDGPWQLADSDDGLFDNLSELLTLSLPKGLASGVHTLAIRVADEAGNIGSATVNFRLP
jgi:hypothetical protein